MTVPHSNRNDVAAQAVSAPQEVAPSGVTAPQPEPAQPGATQPARRVPRTRIGAAWFGIWIAAVAFVVLIIFMMQNTRSVKVTFLWMHGNVPLALALLVAAVGTATLAMAIGAARVTQVRRQSRRR